MPHVLNTVSLKKHNTKHTDKVNTNEMLDNQPLKTKKKIFLRNLRFCKEKKKRKKKQIYFIYAYLL